MHMRLNGLLILTTTVLACASPTLPTLDAGANSGDGGTVMTDGSSTADGVQQKDAGPAAAAVAADAVNDGGVSCPVAVVSASPGSLIVPQSVLYLNGTNSVDASGSAVTKFSWSAKQPPGAKQVFAPSAAVPAPSFTANVAGSYEFCLTVWDAAGQKSCKTACTKVEVVPKAALHVSVTWETPGDTNQENTGPGAGADLDLHIARANPTGPDLDCDGKPDPWFAASSDVFWFSPIPKWAPSNSSTNTNPSFDLDDTDGAGPENLNWHKPLGTVASPKTYDVGVHYWNDHGFGVSTPTVRLYMLGLLVATIQGPPMKPLDFWYVGTMNWPNKASDSASSLTPLQACHQSASPCLKTSPGKMWTATGNHCVRPCYVNPSFTAMQSGSGAASVSCTFP